MGSKKHKKESKKKKHRSRSRSPVDGEERERKRHRKHKDRKKDRSPDVEVVEESPSRSEEREPRSASVERDREVRHQRHYEREKSPVKERSPIQLDKAQDSLSIDETNRLRAKLGLKPLQVEEEPPADDGKLKDDLGEFYHKPAANLSQQKKTEKIRQRLEDRKEKRKIEQKLAIPSLGAAGDDEDAAAWVLKSREVEKQKREAAKRAAMLDEMDEVFGVGSLVAEEQQQQRAESYTQRHLTGLRVTHDLDAISEERETVLTLADKNVLDEEAEDELVNVNLVDDERYKKNMAERKKALSGYKAYDDEAELEAAASGAGPAVLAKYDDVIDEQRAARRAGFRLGDDDALHAQRFRDLMRQERLQGGVQKRLESLQMPERRLAADYLDEHELSAKFKKFKRKGKIRKKLKDETIDVEEYEAGSASLHVDDTDVKPDTMVGDVVEEDEVEVDSELQAALARARRLHYSTRRAATVTKVEDLLESVKEEAVEGGEGMVLDSTAEFCRTLGDIPTYGAAGNRDTQADLMDFEQDMETEESGAGPQDEAGGAWSRVDVRDELPPDITAGTAVGLEAEPSLGAGVGGALQLALSKGYLAPAAAAAPPARPPRAQLLAAQHYTIEDKAHNEDDKYSRRERGYSGALQDFREKSNFKPNIKLEYVDDEGRPLCPKEAFRYLSHKFHGKGPGKNKQEKRIKKQVQEGLMKKMSSTDTPLGTLHMLQEKQRETRAPYVVLQGTQRRQP